MKTITTNTTDNLNRSEKNCYLGLRKTLNRLAEIAADDNCFLSCFLNLEESTPKILETLDQRARFISRQLTGARRKNFDLTYGRIRTRVLAGFGENTKGAVIYAREGQNPFFLALDFEVPLETRLTVDFLPYLYPVIETKDVYERFVLLVLKEESADILEIVAGGITHKLFSQRSQIWRNLSNEKGKSFGFGKDFLLNQFGILTELMTQYGHEHLVIAGDSELVDCFSRHLPSGLKKKVLTTLSAASCAQVDSVVELALDSFAEKENAESHSNVSRLARAVRGRNKEGVSGLSATRDALQTGCARLLLIDANLPQTGEREELLRLAIRNGVPIETVKNNRTLKELSGMGCLLHTEKRVESNLWDERILAS